jgi:predicted amidophosphoribosyltransferase
MPDKPTTSPTSESETGLIQCPACQGKVSRAAPTCPHCGHPLAPPKASPTDDFFARTQKNAADMKKAFVGCLVVVIGFVFFLYIASQCG